MPSVYAPCPDCHGARYNPQTLEILWQGKSIADVLRLPVEEAVAFFADERSGFVSGQVLYVAGGPVG